MNVLYFVLFLLAVVCFVAAASERIAARVNLVALGLAFGTSVFMLQQLAKV
jgi:hypothetical protein